MDCVEGDKQAFRPFCRFSGEMYPLRPQTAVLTKGAEMEQIVLLNGWEPRIQILRPVIIEAVKVLAEEFFVVGGHGLFFKRRLGGICAPWRCPIS